MAQEQAPVTSTGQEAMGKCPLCGKDVVEYSKSYGCTGYKENGCRFAIWKEIAGRKIIAKQARDLLAKGRTEVIKGFKSKSGKSFDAVLVLGQDGKAGFEFPKADSVGRCPLCGKDVAGAAPGTRTAADSSFGRRSPAKS